MSAVVRDCLGVRKGEEVLVVQPGHTGSARRCGGEAAEARAEAVLAVISERHRSAGDPPDRRRGVVAADVWPPLCSRSRTRPRKRASEAGARIATLPGVTEEMLARVMSADMAELRRRGEAVADALDAASEATSCPNGATCTWT